MMIETQDQAYEFFVQESTELLQILEQGLMNLSQVHDMQKLHELMRAAHSIKGGAACVGFMGVQSIAHDLENGIRALYAEDTVFDLELEELLLQAFDCLRSPIVEQIETGFSDEEAAITRSKPIFEQLEAKLGHPLEEAAELPEVPMEGDMTAFLFDEEVPSGLRRWENVLKSGNESKIQAELKTQAEVFSTLGSMLGLSGFTAIADTVLEALEANPQACRQIGQIALKDLWASREAVLAGDRRIGGKPSETLTALTQPIPVQASIVVDVSTEAEADDPSDLFILPPLQETLPAQPKTIELTVYELLLQGLECLRLPLLEQIETGRWHVDESIDQIQKIVQQLEAELGYSLQEIATASDANTTLLSEIEFQHQTEIDTELKEEFKTQMEVFITLGQMLNQSQLSTLASTSVEALENNPQGMLTIGLLVFAGIYAQQKAKWQEQGIAIPALKDNEAELEESVASTENPESTAVVLAVPQDWQDVELELDNGFNSELISDIETVETELTLSSNPDELVDEETLNPNIASFIIEENDSDESLRETNPLALETQPDQIINYEDKNPEITDTDETKNDTYNWVDESTEETDLEQKNTLEITHNIQDKHPIQSSLNGVHTRPQTHHKLQPQTVFSESNNSLKAPIQPQLSLGVRVDVHRLDQLNNLVGELATQDNSLLLQNQKAQDSIDLLERSREKFRKLSVDLQTRARFISQQKQSNSRTALEVNALSNSVQETLEELDQIRASIYDMKLLNLQNQQIIKKRQQTLHKVQKNLTETRMVPVESLLNRFPRMVRDLSVRTQKSIQLELTGEKTLVDKAILEKLYDPLVHLVRNAFDHGIELPEVRLKQGKSPEGKIEIKAYHQGNYTYIEVIDDGQGIDVNKIRNKAVAKQLISVQDAARLSQKQLYDLLFYPGFSTTEKVSELSGRGVGLEAVRRQVEALKGTITIQSQPAKGTQFTLRLPWTLTITKLLVFRIKNSLFSIPMDALAGIVSVLETDIKNDEDAPITTDEKSQKIYDWYGQKVPLVQSVLLEYHHPSAAILSFPQSSETTHPSLPVKSSNKVMLLLISQGLETVALKIDQILMEQNLTIKPFDKILAAPPFCYGCTILGDGRLVPVVDSPELLEHWRQQQQSHLNTLTLKSDQPKRISHSNPAILVIDDSLTTRASLSSTLQKAGYEVVQAKQGREGLTQLQRHSQIQVVICDLEMPEMNGFEFLTHCRREYSQAELPVIILTSRNNDRHRQLAKQLGSNQYLTKPWKEQELIQTLQQFQTQSMAVV
jgi:chemotaxis family two-component system sensor histidine kinase/response regulator PixL